MTDFPNLSKGQDAKYYSEKLSDVARKAETEGGYEITRPRFKRRPRKIFSTGFTNISNDDKLILENFWNQVYGGSSAFNWTNPINQTVILVRFDEELDFKYAGIGGIHRWDVSIKLKEV